MNLGDLKASNFGVEVMFSSVFDKIGQAHC